MFLTAFAMGMLAGTPLGFLLFGFVDIRGTKSAANSELIKSLNDLTRICLRLAHECPHSPTRQGLRDVALELDDRAEELGQFYQSNAESRLSSERDG
jgi:hypothetical protein